MKNSIKLYRNEKAVQPTALTIGNFDGVHIGHQHLLEHLVKQAYARHLIPSVLTFTPHPREFFALRGQRQELIPTRISTLRDKVMALNCHGIEAVYLQTFNQAMAQMSAQDFIQKVLLEQLQVRYLYVGEDFQFGHRRSGNIELLKEAAQQHHFTVEIMQDVLDNHQIRYSSTELRQALAFGQIEKANSFLGRRYSISGHVIHGKKLGRTIGIPTLNIPVMPRCALRSGIYVVSVRGLSEHALPAVASLGVRPTVELHGEVLLEVHILNHSVSAYGRMVTIDFHHYIRDEEKFPDLTTMMSAIQKDIAIAQHYFDDHGL
ncbi:bifunctional riboflavin kinase/FAD synthetase [Pelistega ratti]|uniref:bifunctional riboflavin kinase/FAD synthetase n=1 Tax=Pelistega ratti TaxID=2652177 RepID=UPI001916AD62|nr:bifunctional riboflavin kinase/FAD synthetase [Pelistega ratti]